MAVLAVSVLGAGVGAFFGQPAIGWTIGSIAGQALFGQKRRTSGTPELEDLAIQSGSYGTPIPRIWGIGRVRGIDIWQSKRHSTKHKDNVGGKGGGGQTVVSYTYSIDMAVALCEGPIDAVRKIWMNGKLVYDKSTDATAESLLANNKLWREVRVYLGGSSQEPDTLLESYLGVGNVPAYRGTAYLVIENLQLEEFGNTPPNITAEVLDGATASYLGPTFLLKPETHENYPHYVNDGVIEFWGKSDGNNVAAWYDSTNSAVAGTVELSRRRYDLEGNVLEIIPENINGAGLSGNLFVGPIANIGVLRPVRNLPNVWIGYAWEISVSEDAQYAVWFGPNTAYHQLIYDVNNIPFHNLNGTTLPSGISDGTSLGYPFYYQDEDALYTVVSTTSGPGHVYKFPVAGGIPTNRATALYAGAQSDQYVDVFVNAQGVFVLGETYIVKLDHDLTFVKQWTTPTVPLDESAGFLVKNDMAILANQNQDKSWYVIQLNADGTSTTLGSGTAIGTNEGPPPMVISEDVMLVNRQYITLGLYDSEGVLLSELVTDAVTEAGLPASDIVVSELTDLVTGYARTQPATVAELLRPLQPIYAFDIISSDWKLKFFKRARPSVSAVIPWENLGAHPYGSDLPERLETRRIPDLELPRRVNLDYISQERDYQTSSQYASREATESLGEESLQAALVLSDDKARQSADVILYDRWLSRDEYSFSLPIDYLYLDPGDIVEITAPNASHLVRITNIDLQFPSIIAVRGVSLRPPAFVAETVTPDILEGSYSSESPGAGAPVDQQVVTIPGPTLLHLLDIPLLRDEDNGAYLYAAVLGYLDGWHGTEIFRSDDGGAAYASLATALQEATIGRTTTALPSFTPWTFDEASTVTVALTEGSLSSFPDATWLTGKNNFAAIGVDGRWEIIRFRDATLVSGSTYTLGGKMVRGCFGTEHNIANHAVGDIFVLLNVATVTRLQASVEMLNVERQYKPVSIGRALAVTDAQSHTYQGVILKPLSSVNITGRRDSSSNLTIDWTPRGRLSGQWVDYVETPVGEATESYSIDIMNGSTVVRTLTASTNQVAYTAAQQTTDFGSAQSSVLVNIYKISASVGRGYAGVATV